MPNQGTESQFEETTIDRLRALGYRYVYGGELPRDERDMLLPKLLGGELRVGAGSADL